MDLGIVLGSSSSNYIQLFKEQKDFIKDVLSRLDISSSSVLPGIVTMNRSPKTAIQLGEVNNVDSAKEKISEIANPGPDGKLENALIFVKDKLFATEFGARSGVPKSVLVFINRTPESKNDFSAALKRIKKDSIKVIIIAQGIKIDKEKIKDLIPDADDWFIIEDPKDGKNIVKSVTDSILPDPCDKVNCDYSAKCVTMSDRTTTCMCSVCPDEDVYAPICGDDGRTYATKCRLLKESCRQQRVIGIAKETSCGKFVQNFLLSFL